MAPPNRICHAPARVISCCRQRGGPATYGIIVNGDALGAFRAKIDQIDSTIVDLVAQRLDVCADVAVFKAANGLPMMQPGRVEQVKARVAELAESRGLRGEFLRQLYSLIIEEACSLEQRLMDTRQK